MIELGAAMLLALTGPAVAPPATVPVKRTVKLPHRIRAMTAFDLRGLAVPPIMRSAARHTPDPLPSAKIRREDAEFRIAALVTADREAQYTGRRLRNSAMAAGLSLRMTNDDGVLASQVGMAGSVGKALSRMALQVVSPE